MKTLSNRKLCVLSQLTNQNGKPIPHPSSVNSQEKNPEKTLEHYSSFISHQSRNGVSYGEAHSSKGPDQAESTHDWEGGAGTGEEIEKMKSSQKKLEKDIKKYAKEQTADEDHGQGSGEKQELREQVHHDEDAANSRGSQDQTIKSNEAMSSAMKDVSKCLVLLNKQMGAELQKVMNDFMSEQEERHPAGDHERYHGRGHDGRRL